MDAFSYTLPFNLPANGRVSRLLCGLAGGMCAATIFSVLALSRAPRGEAAPLDVYAARAVSMPIETPPPDPTESAEPVSVAGPIRLEIAASNSTIRIQVPDVPVLVVNPAPPAARPAVIARFDIAKSAARPHIETAETDSRRVFDHSDVDQQPMALQRVQPRITYNEASLVDTPRTTMLLIVNTDGSVGDVRILHTSHDERFDARMIDAIREWRFSPAMRKGRKVRCWVQQSISVQLTLGSRLTLN
jgi:TonB family protein